MIEVKVPVSSDSFYTIVAWMNENITDDWGIRRRPLRFVFFKEEDATAFKLVFKL